MNTMPSFNKIPLLNFSSSELLSLLPEFHLLEPTHWHFAAGSTFVEAQNNESLRSILLQGKVFCDSLPVAKFLSWTGIDITQVRGSDFLNLAITGGMKGKHFFLGGETESLNLLLARVKTEKQDFKIVGTSDALISLAAYDYEVPIDLIRNSEADVIWICLGSPKQDFVAAKISLQLNVHCIAIGAALDFYSGYKLEAPLLLRRAGFEWFFRLISEPRRLWKRYLFGNLALLRMMFSNTFRKN